jgi:hypothetical protein
MLKLNKLCNVCKHAQDNPKLLKAIYDSRAFIPSSSVSLKNVYDQYAAFGAHFSYEALLRHSKKHQFMNEQDFNSRHLREIAKTAEKQILRRQIDSKTVWDTVITQGMEKLESGELVMRTQDLLKAAKDKSDFELKVKDQELAMVEMVAHFASGEGDMEESRKYDRRIIEGQAVEDYDPTLESAATTERRTAQSRSFYQSLAGDAPSPRTD